MIVAPTKITARLGMVKADAPVRRSLRQRRAPEIEQFQPDATLRSPGGGDLEVVVSPAENAPWGFLEWAVAGLASIVASATAFVWRLMTRLHTLEIAVRQQRHDLDAAQSNNK